MFAKVTSPRQLVLVPPPQMEDRTGSAKHGQAQKMSTRGPRDEKTRASETPADMSMLRPWHMQELAENVYHVSLAEGFGDSDGFGLFAQVQDLLIYCCAP